MGARLSERRVDHVAKAIRSEVHGGGALARLARGNQRRQDKEKPGLKRRTVTRNPSRLAIFD